MKTLKQVQKENKYGDVMSLSDFIESVNIGLFCPYDGYGYFHDGKKRTEISVWDNSLTLNDIINYPYVCWYNR